MDDIKFTRKSIQRKINNLQNKIQREIDKHGMSANTRNYRSELRKNEWILEQMGDAQSILINQSAFMHMWF